VVEAIVSPPVDGGGARWPEPRVLVIAAATALGAIAFAWSERDSFIHVAQTAVLDEPAFGGGTNQTLEASVKWRLIDHGAGGPEIVGTIDVPKRGLAVTLSIRKNLDQSLPVSHLVQITTANPPYFARRSVADVSEIAFKPGPEAPGKPLIGTIAKVDEGLFLAGLSALPADVAANLETMKAGFLDLKLVYKSGEQVALTFEKGSTGTPLFDAALAAWRADAGIR
jgi:hypothetical protein